MEIEIPTTEKWVILEELSKDGVCFRPLSPGNIYLFSGQWHSYHPTNPKLRAAVERQWNKLRPLAENEWRVELRGDCYIVRFYRNGYRITFPDNVFSLGGGDEEIEKAWDLWANKTQYDCAEPHPRRRDCWNFHSRTKKPLKENEFRDNDGRVAEFRVIDSKPQARWTGPGGASAWFYACPERNTRVDRACLAWHEKHRPLKQNEWRDAFGEVVEFRDHNGVPQYRMLGESSDWKDATAFVTAGARCLAWHEKHYGDPLKINGRDIVDSECTRFAGVYFYRLKDSSGYWHDTPKERFDRYCEAIAKKHRDENTVNGYEFRMGEFGVEVKYCGSWYTLAHVSGSKDSAREWMRRKGIKLQ